MATCPICKAAAKPRAENASFPFCGARCKMIDLGKWMSEDYRVPVEARASDEPQGPDEGVSPRDGDELDRN